MGSSRASPPRPGRGIRSIYSMLASWNASKHVEATLHERAGVEHSRRGSPCAGFVRVPCRVRRLTERTVACGRNEVRDKLEGVGRLSTRQARLLRAQHISLRSKIIDRSLERNQQRSTPGVGTSRSGTASISPPAFSLRPAFCLAHTPGVEHLDRQPGPIPRQLAM